MKTTSGDQAGSPEGEARILDLEFIRNTMLYMGWAVSTNLTLRRCYEQVKAAALAELAAQPLNPCVGLTPEQDARVREIREIMSTELRYHNIYKAEKVAALIGPLLEPLERERDELLRDASIWRNDCLHANAQLSEAIAPLERQLSYPYMCRDEHVEIGHFDSSSEMCPLCRSIADADKCAESAEIFRKRAEAAEAQLSSLSLALEELRDAIQKRLNQHCGCYAVDDPNWHSNKCTHPQLRAAAERARSLVVKP